MTCRFSSERAPRVDARQVWRNFQRAASGYDAASFLPREIGRRMLERLDCVKLDPEVILDLGCGTGVSIYALQERYRNAYLAGADFSENMIRAGRARQGAQRWLLPRLLRSRAGWAVTDATALAFAGDSMDLIWSNMALHWLRDPLRALREIYRTLKTGGLLMFSTLGPETLKELRSCFTDADTHTQSFIDMHEYGDRLVECGYRDPVMEVETLTLTYPSLQALVRELRLNGATCAAPERRRRLMGRAFWQAVERRYEEQAIEGRLHATFEIIYGHAWKLPAARPRPEPSEKTMVFTLQSPSAPAR